MTSNWILAIAALLAQGCASHEGNEPHSELLIRQVRIVSPANLTVGPASDVLVRDGKIVNIGDKAAGRASDAVEVLEGDRRFLLPGLIDGHVHLNEVPGMTLDHEKTYQKVAQDARRQIPRSYLYYGFTTVVDLNAEPGNIKKWNSRDIRPQAYFCGASPVFDGYPMSFMPKPARYTMMPYFLFDESRAADFPAGFKPKNHSPAAVVQRIQEDGGICVKTHYEKGFGGRGDLPVPSADLVRELVAAAHEASLPVLMHANSEASQAFGVETGIDAFAHGMWTWNDRKTMRLHKDITAIVDTTISRGIALQPTVQVLYGEQNIHDPDYFSDPRLRDVLPASILGWYETDAGQWWRTRMLKIPIVSQLVAEGRWAELDAPPIARVSAVLENFAKKGGRLLFGSDTPSDPTFANPPGLNGRIEMDRWIAAGVTPLQLFAAATLGNAEFYGLADQIGTIEVGKKADFLMTRENPLETISAYDAIDYVILSGKVIERESLSAMAASE